MLTTRLTHAAQKSKAPRPSAHLLLCCNEQLYLYGTMVVLWFFVHKRAKVFEVLEELEPIFKLPDMQVSDVMKLGIFVSLISLLCTLFQNFVTTST